MGTRSALRTLEQFLGHHRSLQRSWGASAGVADAGLGECQASACRATPQAPLGAEVGLTLPSQEDGLRKDRLHRRVGPSGCRGSGVGVGPLLGQASPPRDVTLGLDHVESWWGQKRRGHVFWQVGPPLKLNCLRAPRAGHAMPQDGHGGLPSPSLAQLCLRGDPAHLEASWGGGSGPCDPNGQRPHRSQR